MGNALEPGTNHSTVLNAADQRVLWRSTLLPEILIIVCTLILIWFFRRLLADAQRSDIELDTLLPMFFAVMGLAVASAVLVVGQASRSARRLAGPSQRLIMAMQRACRGDIAHRVHLRHGDALKDVAAEFNRLLDWLNENPPAGVKTGQDLIEVEDKDLLEDIGLDSSEIEAREPEVAVDD